MVLGSFGFECEMHSDGKEGSQYPVFKEHITVVGDRVPLL